MRAPEEVYKAEQQGAPRAPEELTREERSAARQKRKRAGKKQKAQQVSITSIVPVYHCCQRAHTVESALAGISSDPQM